MKTSPSDLKSKTCFKCSENKPLTAFYKHPATSDGFLNKCKDCTKSDAKRRHYQKLQDPEWVEKEKARNREKYHKLGYRGKFRPSTERKAEVMARYFRKYPEKQIVYNLSQHLKPEVPGNHLHHWCYHPSCAKDVIELTPTQHYGLHRLIIYDQYEMLYRLKETGELLDDKYAHIFLALGVPF